MNKKLALGVVLCSFAFMLGILLIPSSAEAAISYGSEYSVNVGDTTHTSIANIDSNRFVLAYSDASNSNRGTAIICQTSGTTITTCGSESVFESAGADAISVVGLDSTHFAVAYAAGDGRTYAIIGNVSGTTISSYGTSVMLVNGDSDYNSISKLSSTKIVVAYQDTDKAVKDSGAAVIGTVSGDTITLGTLAHFDSQTPEFISVSEIDSTHFVIGYRDTGNSNRGTGIIGQVSGTTITYGSGVVFENAGADAISVVGLDSTHFAVAYFAGDGRTRAIIGNISGTTISSYGTSVILVSADSDYNSISKLSSTKIVVAYQGKSAVAKDRGTAIIGTVSGDTITLGTPVDFNTATSEYISLYGMDSEYFAIGYRDTGNSNYGTGIIGYEQQQQVIPELPNNNLWKILIAVLALGLVVGVAAWKKKKGTSAKTEKE